MLNHLAKIVSLTSQILKEIARTMFTLHNPIVRVFSWRQHLWYRTWNSFVVHLEIWSVLSSIHSIGRYCTHSLRKAIINLPQLWTWQPISAICMQDILESITFFFIEFKAHCIRLNSLLVLLMKSKSMDLIRNGDKQIPTIILLNKHIQTNS